MDRYETILRNRRRRDNICDYIRGLHKSECWPYPNGASRSTPVTEQGKDGLKKVELRSDKITELMELFLINVDRQHPLAMNRYWHRGVNGYHPLAPATRRMANKCEVELADVHIELCRGGIGSIRC
jgi:hypothetical protein